MHIIALLETFSKLNMIVQNSIYQDNSPPTTLSMSFILDAFIPLILGYREGPCSYKRCPGRSYYEENDQRLALREPLFLFNVYQHEWHLLIYHKFLLIDNLIFVLDLDPAMTQYHVGNKMLTK